MRAWAYLRTSSVTNCGEGKDSPRRQRAAIRQFADRFGAEIVGEFYDQGVSGGDMIEVRPGFGALLDAIEASGVKVVVIEDVTRLARSVVTQELAIVSLLARGVQVYTASGDEITDESDEMRIVLRQVAAAFAQAERSRAVKRLRAARERLRALGQKVEGRPSLAQREGGWELAATARRLHRRSCKTGQRRSLTAIAAELARQGHTTTGGNPFGTAAIKRLLAWRPGRRPVRACRAASEGVEV